MRVRFTPQAERQFLDVLRFLIRRDPAGAAAIHRRTEDAIAPLREHPFAGQAIPEFADLPQRELSVTPYRLFYRVSTTYLERRIPARPSAARTPGKDVTPGQTMPVETRPPFAGARNADRGPGVGYLEVGERTGPSC